ISARSDRAGSARATWWWSRQSCSASAVPAGRQEPPGREQALHRGHDAEDRQRRQDGQQRPRDRQAEDQTDVALQPLHGPLGHAEAGGLGLGPEVAHQQRDHQRRQGHGRGQLVAVDGQLGQEDRPEDDPVRDAVDSRIEQRPLAALLAPEPGHPAVEDVEEPRHQEEESRDEPPSGQQERRRRAVRHQGERGQHPGFEPRAVQAAQHEPVRPLEHPPEQRADQAGVLPRRREVAQPGSGPAAGHGLSIPRPSRPGNRRTMLAVPLAIPVEASLEPDVQEAVDARLRRMDDKGMVARIWGRDHTVWRPDSTEIADRLGWLTAPHASRTLVPELLALAQGAAAEGLTHTVLMGMGGSSLAPEVLRTSFGLSPGGLDLRVLDSTHPAAITAVEDQVPLGRALFVVSSKSGTTIETRSHMAYFLDRTGDPRRFVAVTDPGTPLEAEAEAAGFRAVVRAAPDVGGRYSALTAFGLLPAALIGAGVEALLRSGADAAAACGGSVGIHANPGAVVGAILGEAVGGARDKLTLRIADPVGALGAWIEQLVAESTGKDGTGIIPVADELGNRGPAPDRLFVALGDDTSPEPWVRLPLGAPGDLGAAFFVLEFVTAVAGHVLGIHPFDQPDVQAAKDRTEEVLAAGEIPAEPPGDLEELLGSVRPGDYVAIQAFVGPDPE